MLTKTAGFSIVELLVSIAIISIIVTTIVLRQDNFNQSVLLRNQAYDVAFAIREVQQSAVSVVNTSGSIGDIRSALGLYFETGSSTYYIYRDKDNNKHYNQSEEYGSPGRLDSRFRVVEIKDEDGAPYSKVSIAYQRPNFDAVFYNHLATGPVELAKKTLKIVIASVADSAQKRTILITSTGQISVEPVP